MTWVVMGMAILPIAAPPDLAPAIATHEVGLPADRSVSDAREESGGARMKRRAQTAGVRA